MEVEYQNTATAWMGLFLPLEPINPKHTVHPLVKVKLHGSTSRNLDALARSRRKETLMQKWYIILKTVLEYLIFIH